MAREKSEQKVMLAELIFNFFAINQQSLTINQSEGMLVGKGGRAQGPPG